jgi:hypothetical protein
MSRIKCRRKHSSIIPVRVEQYDTTRTTLHGNQAG